MAAKKIWHRLPYKDQVLYVNPERPDWFVPNERADQLLKTLIDNDDIGQSVCDAERSGSPCEIDLLGIRRSQAQLLTDSVGEYRGRSACLKLEALKECWFHLTDRCNLACRHCLFGSSPAQAATLPIATLEAALAEAALLGCTIYYFTGGEPFVYPDFSKILARLLLNPANHVVVLTNGLLIEEHLAAIAALPRDRLHLQISMDGLAENHDAQRGAGTFARLLTSLDLLKKIGLAATLSVAVNRTNVDDLPGMISLAATHGVKNIHLLWHFVRGKGNYDQFVEPLAILPQLIAAQEIAEGCGVLIDNVETLKSQVFSTPGTRHDLSNTGWESIAVGPNGVVYPSPALVGIKALACGRVEDGLDVVWRQSPVLEAIRKSSLLDSAKLHEDPFRFLTGGGDIDHSYLAGGEFVGHDPYMQLYNGLAAWLIGRQARKYPIGNGADILLRMGDVRYDCPDGGREVSLTHCNCVISLADDLGHGKVREFYGRAAIAANEEIVNPFAPDQAAALFIPADSRKKSYGCGSPVKDATVQKDEVVIDLGSGSGVECFMAASLAGPTGKVFGIDMTDEMLALARQSKKEVAKNLGYDNVQFIKGFLEEIPLNENSADVVISNCVINLSPDKRRTFHEIYRILKPGGRLVISDIVTDTPIPVAIKNNEKFRGECLGGALLQEQLLAMLRAAGFVDIHLIKRFFYRKVGETLFYSLTFRGYKPATRREVEVIYRGPFAGVYTETGDLLLMGRRTRISLDSAGSLDESVFVIDDAGQVSNIKMESNCCASEPAPLQILTMAPSPPPPLPKAESCCAPDNKTAGAGGGRIIALPPNKKVTTPLAARYTSGCMVCGESLSYLHSEEKASCHFCGKINKTQALCENRHYICDDCHQEDGLFAIKLICTETKETDMVALLKKIRSHPAMPMHGPEHHALVPGVILSTYRNLGGPISRETILGGIDRGSKVPGGVCGFWGNCGAATGVGIAFAAILGSTPLTPEARQQVQLITARVLAKIAAIKGARCCQRESLTAIKEAAAIAAELLEVRLLADETLECDQYEANRECVRRQCPLWSRVDKEDADGCER